MLQPPSLKQIPLYPVTVAIAAASIAVTGLWWNGWNIDAVDMNGLVWARWEFWRTLTSTLPHVNFFHLAFNLYWLWAFGTLVERIFGHFKYLLLIILLAFGSSLAEFALFSGGVGLSGVGYGLWGMLWVLEKRDPRFTEAVDYKTSRLFVVWFFLCIVLTLVNIMPVANVAHGAGAVMGGLLGLILSSDGAFKRKCIVSLAMLMALVVLGSTVFWPQINLGGNTGLFIEMAGLDALDRNDTSQAVKLLEISTRMSHAPARAWYNLGVAYQRADRYGDAISAYEHAAQMPGGDNQMSKAADDLKLYMSGSNELRQSKFKLLTTIPKSNQGMETNQ